MKSNGKSRNKTRIQDAPLVLSFLLFVTQIITILCLGLPVPKDKQTKQTITSKSNFKRDTCALEGIELFETTDYFKQLVAQSCQTLWDLMDCSPPGSSVHGIFQERILEWEAIPFPRGSSQPSLLHCRQILCHLNHQGSL